MANRLAVSDGRNPLADKRRAKTPTFRKAIDGALPDMPSVKARHRALPHEDVAPSLCAIRASTASAAARLCLEFLVMTASRSGQARGAIWDEVDLASREWRIGAERMKAHAPSQKSPPITPAPIAPL